MADVIRVRRREYADYEKIVARDFPDFVKMYELFEDEWVCIRDMHFEEYYPEKFSSCFDICNYLYKPARPIIIIAVDAGKVPQLEWRRPIKLVKPKLRDKIERYIAAKFPHFALYFRGVRHYEYLPQLRWAYGDGECYLAKLSIKRIMALDKYLAEFEVKMRGVITMLPQPIAEAVEFYWR
jgi:hypothetical protein